MNKVVTKRVFEIDVLRGIAVTLVMFRHFHSTDYSIKIPILQEIGWIGVDLFFVLSGFLISSLLYKEIEINGNINFKRFFIRRGFKIYPSFYGLIIFTIIVKIITKKSIDLKELFAECLFLQSYLKGMLVHSWSLGVEEHFYIFLPIIIIFYINLTAKKIEKSNFITLLFITIGTFCLLWRCYNALYAEPELYRSAFNTHIRMDSLFFGVFLSFHYRYNFIRLKQLVSKYYFVFILTFLIIIPMPYFYDITSAFISSIGFTLLYISFGMLLLLVLFSGDILKSKHKIIIHIFKPFAFIGFYSYTIYLWHIPVEGLINRLNIYNNCNVILAFIVYLLISIIAGVVMSKAIETPALKIREKYYK